MMEFRGISIGATITTKNNMNNVMVGNKIEIDGVSDADDEDDVDVKE